MQRLIESLLRKSLGERGQAMAEYSLILAFVAMSSLVSLGLLGFTLAVEVGR